jgi:hypothetical protein
MSYIFTETPELGAAGPGYASDINAILDEAKAAINSNYDLISSLESVLNSHNHDDRYYTESEIDTMLESYAASSHNHITSAIQSAIEDGSGATGLDDVLLAIVGASTVPVSLTTLKSWYDVMNPDVSASTVSASMYDSWYGIRVAASISPNVYVRAWKVTIKLGAAVVYEATGAGNVFMVPSDNFSDGDALSIQVVAYTGTTDATTSSWYSHTYNENTHPMIASMQTQLDGLTVSAIVDAFAADADALQALANAVHSSNTLAQKVSELMS